MKESGEEDKGEAMRQIPEAQIYPRLLCTAKSMSFNVKPAFALSKTIIF
jgi:hypothetical protein